MIKTTVLLCFITIGHTLLAQGPYAPPVGQVGTKAIHQDSSVFVAWASEVSVARGLQDMSNPSLGYANAGTSAAAIGKSGENGIVSLGDGGTATLSFDAPIKNGVGPDFAVFENAFSNDFLELAFVEVSSDGAHFFRFDAVSLTNTDHQTPSFGLTDATQLYNLAGKYKAQYGTPFDLDELAGTPGLDVNHITHIRIKDVVGSIDPTYASYDAQNNMINDPWPTAFGGGGFDLDAVGVIHSTATAIETWKNARVTFFPNPCKNRLTLQSSEQAMYAYKILDYNGKTMLEGDFKSNFHQVNLSDLKAGIYFFQLISKQGVTTQQLIKE